jgi:hypothetical protein
VQTATLIAKVIRKTDEDGRCLTTEQVIAASKTTMDMSDACLALDTALVLDIELYSALSKCKTLKERMMLSKPRVLPMKTPECP